MNEDADGDGNEVEGGYENGQEGGARVILRNATKG